MTVHAVALALSLALAPAEPAQPAEKAQTKPAPDLKNFDMSRKPDLSQFSSYNWSKDQVALLNLANHIRLINVIQQQMKDHGYRIDTVKPDVIIQYKADRHTAVRTESSQKPSSWDPTDLKVQVELSREEQVSLQILLVEAESGFLLWEAKGSYPIGTPDKAEKLIKEAVNGLFASYPKEE
jgi:hypothetical protein